MSKIKMQITQLLNTAMAQAEADRRAEDVLQRIMEMLEKGPKQNNERTVPSARTDARPEHATQGIGDQVLTPGQAAQPSWASITGASKGSGWTTVANGKRKPKKHPLDQRRILFARNVQSHSCDPRDIMFEANKALANARAHVTVRLIKMRYTEKGNLTGVVSQHACADELLNYATVLMAAVKKLDPEVVLVEKTEKWRKLRVHGVALDRYTAEGGLKLAREEIELMTGEQLPYPPRWLKGDSLGVSVLQHNCNRTAVSTTAALEAALERGVEVACLQEPHVGKRHTICHPGFQLRYPECAKQDARVALAIRNDALDRYVFEERTDLVNSPHVQCLDIWETTNRRKTRRTRLINIYNKARVEGGGYTIDHLDWRPLIEGRTILAGDFNARSPKWDRWIVGRQNAGTTERLIERHDLIVNNNDHQATRRGKNCKSVIDLTLSSRKVGALTTWEIDEELATTSDHEVIVFEWTPLNAAATDGPRGAPPNWSIDRLCADGEALKKAGEHWHELSEGRLLVNAWVATPAELEAEACWMQESLKTVLDRHAPGRPPCARSKRWWTDEIK
ncbi:Endonuclease/exonuclease/phosphatase [Metarhizium album ARSEF 1941]|uniref:Endonuclease/exonuclease/phosphatase n=1 Tax=Metarhizium album (strain ARSEF 1941) TaxID=1081103 RepID=A0A0B2WCW3_METAS|nr:Endonuclease/exonuclease/phosphatase [Metarhizium album ARSEF 1941]KHN93671.1 Endonuclease/exonuclease/phosphatase [Metarhizium album ARSEF 1941]